MLMALLLAAAPEPAAGQTWPAFRGRGDSRTDAANLPLTWSDDRNLAWKAALPGYGQSSPVVWKERVFVTSIEGEMKDRLHLFCLERATGRTLWRKEFRGTQKVKWSDYVSKAAPTPAVDAERVYALFESGDLLALDHDGKLLWQRALTKDYGEFRNNHGLGSSLAWSAGALVVLVAQNEHSYLLAVDPRTGRNLWRKEHPFNSSWSSPVIVPGEETSLVLVSSNGTVEAFDLKDGSPLWQVDGLTGNTVASPSTGGGLVVVGSSEKDSQLAIRLGGKGKVTDSHVAWQSEEASSSFGSPLVHGGQVYTVNRAGIAWCLDLKTGKTCWSARLPASCWASPLGAGERVYFFATDGSCSVFQAGPEMKLLAENRLTVNGRVYGVAAVDGMLLIRTGDTLFGVGKP
jgi:outer membrane protein assembly factor BamB